MKEKTKLMILVPIIIGLSISLFFFPEDKEEINRIEQECREDPECWIIIDDFSDSNYIIPILAVIIPIVIVISATIYFFPKKNREENKSNHDGT